LDPNISGLFEPQLSQKTIKSILATEMAKMTYRTRLKISYDNDGQSYDYLTTMPKLRSTYDGRLIDKMSYDYRKIDLR